MNNSVNPIALALVSGFTFIALGYSYDVRHLKELIKKSIEHTGLAYLDVLQPCPTYNDINTRELVMKEWVISTRIHKNRNRGSTSSRIQDMTDVSNPKRLILKWCKLLKNLTSGDERSPIGLFYQNEQVPSYKERIESRIPSYVRNSPARQTIMDHDGVPTGDISKLLVVLE